MASGGVLIETMFFGRKGLSLYRTDIAFNRAGYPIVIFNEKIFNEFWCDRRDSE